ncbi:UNVERIFIED_CONTAM: Acetylserotonin O-methyltransferase [Sesamum radiatum]|uniref:Acetylserotonin O-methyltransferase n=1 Tax=Sesamum radiatum TaxID=300843 RepID=A0AAW2U9S9_SESRA
METQSFKVDEEAQAQVDIWNYVFGFTPMAVVKCAIELQIAEVLESHGGAITLSELSAALGCSSLPLNRIMSPVMLAPWHRLRSALTSGASSFEAAHGEDVWEYAAANPSHSKLINDAMACHARLAVSTIINRYPEAFKGIGSLVDVGGGNGTALQFCGDMFEIVPNADAAFLMSVLHDWGDDECIDILKNCREAIPKDTGKVMIVEAVIDEGEEDKYVDVRLALDMVMLAHTEKGKERTIKEWEYVVKAAGFTRFTVKHVQTVLSVIEAYP